MRLRGLGSAPSVALIVVAGAARAGLYVERLCFRPFGERAAIASMISSFAVWMQIEEAATLLLPRHLNAFPRLAAAAPIEVGPFFSRPEHLLMLVVGRPRRGIVSGRCTTPASASACAASSTKGGRRRW